MKFGSAVGNIPQELNFPDEPVANRKFLTKQSTTLKLGAPLWGNASWVGTLYSPETSAKNFLRIYSRKFNSVELNSSFYGIPLESTVEKWVKETPPDFLFCPKFFSGISHAAPDANTPMRVHQFCQVIKKFGANLGASFIQFSEDFGPNRFEDLVKILQCIPSGLKVAVELRHPGWFRKNQLIAPAVELLQRLTMAAVITDSVGRRDVLHLNLTAPFAFVRFTGCNFHPQDLIRIDHWAAQIAKWKEGGLKEIYFFVHEPDEAFIPATAHLVTTQIRKKTDLSVLSWKEIDFDLNPQLELPI